MKSAENRKIKRNFSESRFETDESSTGVTGWRHYPANDLQETSGAGNDRTRWKEKRSQRHADPAYFFAPNPCSSA